MICWCWRVYESHSRRFLKKKKTPLTLCPWISDHTNNHQLMRRSTINVAFSQTHTWINLFQNLTLVWNTIRNTTRNELMGQKKNYFCVTFFLLLLWSEWSTLPNLKMAARRRYSNKWRALTWRTQLMSQLQSTGHRIELSYHNTQPSLSNSPPVNIKNKTKCRKKSDHQNYEVKTYLICQKFST